MDRWRRTAARVFDPGVHAEFVNGAARVTLDGKNGDARGRPLPPRLCLVVLRAGQHRSISRVPVVRERAVAARPAARSPGDRGRNARRSANTPRATARRPEFRRIGARLCYSSSSPIVPSATCSTFP